MLVTFPARYLHSPFALYSLKANLGPLRDRARILEIGPEVSPENAAERILSAGPRVAAFNVYLWSLARVEATLDVLAAVAPAVWRIAGGPQITADTAAHLENTLPAHYFVVGEGETVFAGLCADLLAGHPPRERTRIAAEPDLAGLALPYALYDDADLRHRILYAETMRGCPFHCDYCTSAARPGLRGFPLPRLFAALDAVIGRGARQVKLLDRSFNARPEHALRVLDFFHAQALAHPGLRLHLELVPEILPPALLRRLADFPPGCLHLELGVQTLDRDVAARIHRRIDPQRVLENIDRLRGQTGAELHLDLIFGLPGETLDGFARGFDTLVGLAPQALQVNRLKRLPGTPLAAVHDPDLRFSSTPPYGILQSDVLSFSEIMRLERFARFWDRIHNRGRFPDLAREWRAAADPFRRVMAFTDFAAARLGRAHAVSRARMLQVIEEFAGFEPAAAGCRRDVRGTSIPKGQPD